MGRIESREILLLRPENGNKWDDFQLLCMQSSITRMFEAVECLK